MAAALLTLCRSARYFIDQIIPQLFIILLISFYTSALVQNSQLCHNIASESSVFEMTSYLALFALLATNTLATLPAHNPRRINSVNSVPAALDAHLRLLGRGG